METTGQQRRVCVAVASSRVGRSALEALEEIQSLIPWDQRVPVRAVLRDAARGDPNWVARGVEMVSGLDVSNEASLREAFTGVTKALVVAPQLENRDEIVNFILDAAHQCGVQHVVLIGGVFQEEEKFKFHLQWMSTRRKAEHLGLTWTQLECSDFMENLLGSAPAIRQNGSFYGPFANGISSPVALEDIGRAAAAVLLDNSGHFENRALRIVGPEALTPKEVARKLSEATGSAISFEEIDLETSKQMALAAGRAPWQVQGFAEWQQIYFATGRLRDVRSDLPLLGIQPVTLDQWLRQRAQLFMRG